MFRHLVGKIIITLLIALASSAGAEPAIIISYDYYDIEGRTAAELREQMDRNGVLWTNGNTYDAYTGWNVKWDYRYRVTDHECSIGSVTTTLNVEFRLPRWIDYAGGPAALRKKWDDYMQPLRHHEDGHKNFGVKAAAEIERSIAELESADTCDDLAETANELGRSIISEYTAAEGEYDAQTNFGEAQGAVFP
jgi:predicted secreted Zn-dependent protease